jgi:hypothetical protein
MVHAADRFPPSVRAGALYTAAYLLVAVGVAAGLRGNVEFVLYAVVVLGLAALLTVIHARAGLPVALLWCLSGWGLLHMLGGLVPVPAGWPTHGGFDVLYSLWIVPGRLKFDQLVHAYGFGTTAWLCWACLVAIGGGIRPTLGPLVLCAAAAMGFGALNEVVEFAATLLLPETNVGGYENTGWDLVANAVGATAAMLIVRLRAGAGRSSEKRAEPVNSS